MIHRLQGEQWLPPRSSIGWFDGVVRYIDQRRLPHSLEIVETDDWRVIARAIKNLSIRGAPLIGIGAAMGVAACAVKNATVPSRVAGRRIQAAINGLRSTRPTAMNLFWALDRMQQVLDISADIDDLCRRLVKAASEIHADDRQRCRRIGSHGAVLIPDGGSVLTICNAGFLATGGDGTALAAIYSAVDAGKLVQVFAPETRPLLQGARLTVWEMTRAGIPVTLIVDSAVAALTAGGEIDICIIGADRIAANGDTANKIGSYQTAISCHRHGIPFYIAAPLSTIDAGSADGNSIVIEERSASEVTGFGRIRTTPTATRAWNPAFDVVPAELINGIIIEEGVLLPPFDFGNGA